MKNPIFVIVILLLVLSVSCQDETSPVSKPDIYGSWTKYITDSENVTFLAELKINRDNTYNFILRSDAPGHTNSAAKFTVNGDLMTIVEDEDCSNEPGKYRCKVTFETLILETIEDGCSGRMVAIEGLWNKI